jgi:sugar phosphate permease
MLTTWFASKERGTYWGLWNIAHNFGGFLAPIIAGSAANYMGWRWGMFVPGIMGIVMGIYVLFATSDSPEKEGYKPVEVIKPMPKKGVGGVRLSLIVSVLLSPLPLFRHVAEHLHPGSAS